MNGLRLPERHAKTQGLPSASGLPTMLETSVGSPVPSVLGATGWLSEKNGWPS